MSSYHETKKRNPLSEDGMTVSNPRRAAAAYRTGEHATMQAALPPMRNNGSRSVSVGDRVRVLSRHRHYDKKNAAHWTGVVTEKFASGDFAVEFGDGEEGVYKASEVSHISNRRNPLSEDGAVVSNPKRPRYKVVAVAKPRPKTTSRRMPGQRMVANPYEEEMDEDELERERQQREDAVLLRGLGPNVGLNADWNESAYYIAPKGGKANRTSGAIYLNNLEGGDWSLVQVIYDEEEGTSDFEPLKTFGSVQEAVNYISSHRDDLEQRARQKANPRRKRTKGKAKHTGSRTAAQSNAARAMKLFHSAQASSLAEAWDIIRSGR
jgi:hypothetical protein